MNISSIRIGVRLGLGFGGVLLLSIAVAAIGIWRLQEVGSMTNALVAGELRQARLAQEEAGIMAANTVRTIAALKTTDPDAEKYFLNDIAKLTAHAGEVLAQLKNGLADPTAKALYEDLMQKRAAYQAARAVAFKEKAAGNFAASNKFLNEDMKPKIDAFQASIDRIDEHYRQQIALAAKAVDTQFRDGRMLLVGLTLGTLVVAIGFAAWVTRSITRPLGEAVGVVQRVAAGDLTGTIAPSGRDETADLLRSMQSMTGTLKDFHDAQARMKSEHDAGTTSYRIPADRFGGSYRDMAAMTNELVAAHIGEKTKIIDVVTRYAEGDLSVDMDALPGEKAKITEAVAGVKASLQSINADVARLVEAALDGDFSVRGDAARYQHDFRKLVDGLNRLMQTNDTALNEMVRVLEALARGDLTQKITRDYRGTFGRLKDGSNSTVDRLSEMVVRIKESTESIGVASREIAAGNSDLSSRTEEQASSLQETASSMGQLTATVRQNAGNATQARQLAVGASEVAVKGGTVVGQVVATMSSINESSRKIVDIIGTIDGIAFQTNILALNAAVEAARAGEQGRGFAVVATEVRNLAQRSAAAAREIKTLIGDSVDKVDTGTRLVDEAGRTMDEIVTAVKRVTDIMADIATASEEQSAGIEQVNHAIAQMDEVTQQNAALVEEAAAAAESMEEQTGRLTDAMAVFTLAHAGMAAATAGTPRVGSLPARRKAA